MRNNTPLDDGDRWDWLIALRDAAIESLQTRSAVVVTCSALKKKYRDVMRVAAYNHPMVQIHFIYLDAEEDVLVQRVTARKDHYMPPTMVHSQLQALEKPVPGSEGDAITVSCNARPNVVQDRVNREVDRIMEEYKWGSGIMIMQRAPGAKDRNGNEWRMLCHLNTNGAGCWASSRMFQPMRHQSPDSYYYP